jgi:hypothetical protein
LLFVLANCVDAEIGNSWFDHDNTYIYKMCM